MPKARKRIGPRRQLAEPREVTPLRRVLTDSEERQLIKNGCLVLPDRGGIPLLSVLNQAYDVVNVVALDLLLGTHEQCDIRKLDKALERRMQAMLKGTGTEAGEVKTYRARVRVVAVIG